jgi:hypothetical protein
VRASLKAGLTVGGAVAIVIAGVCTYAADPDETVTLTNDNPYRVALSCEAGYPAANPGAKLHVPVSIFDPQPCYAYTDDLSTKSHVGLYVGCLFIDLFTSHTNEFSSQARPIGSAKCGTLGSTH